jgi:hypothetical protein
VIRRTGVSCFNGRPYLRAFQVDQLRHHLRHSGVFLFALLVLTGCSAIGQSRRESLAEFDAYYRTWCAYYIEIGETSPPMSSCINLHWSGGQDGSIEKLHKSFDSIAHMNQYLALDAIMRDFCNELRSNPEADFPLLYLDPFSRSMIDPGSWSSCKQTLAMAVNMSEILQSIDLERMAEQGRMFNWSSPQTYVIDGQVFNDPYGRDYKNDASDVYGDGR